MPHQAELTQTEIPKYLRDYRGELDEAEIPRDRMTARLTAHVLETTPNNRKRRLRSAVLFTQWHESGEDVAEFAKNVGMTAEGFRISVNNMAAVALNAAYDDIQHDEGDLIEEALLDPELVATKPKRLEQIVPEVAVSDVPVAPLESWNTMGACAGKDTEAFFPEVGQTANDARKFCARCDVREECLKYALDHNEDFGVWGGKTAFERKEMRRESKQ